MDPIDERVLRNQILILEILRSPHIHRWAEISRVIRSTESLIETYDVNDHV